MRISRIYALTLIAVISVACGSTPTEPAPATQSANVSTTPSGGPVPTPTPSPTPTPTPTPTPSPTPAPGPAKQGVDYYDADVATVFWAGPFRDKPLFGNQFVIEVWRTRGELWLHQTRLWITHQDADTVIATDRNPNSGSAHTLTATLMIKTGQWSFNGEAGSGGGSLTFKESK